MTQATGTRCPANRGRQVIDNQPASGLTSKIVVTLAPADGLGRLVGSGNARTPTVLFSMCIRSRANMEHKLPTLVSASTRPIAAGHTAMRSNT